MDREVGYTGKKVRAQEMCGQGGGLHREESQSSGDVWTGRWATQGRKSELRRCVDREVGYTGKKVRAQEMCGQGGGLHREESQSSGDVWTGRWATQGRKSELRRCVDREVGYTGKKVRAQEMCGQGGGLHREESQSSGDVWTGRWATQGRKSELRRCVDREVGYTGKKVRAQEMCGQGGGLHREERAQEMWVQGGGLHREESQSSGDVWTGRWALALVPYPILAPSWT